jgi:ABC-2 type transport system permease protein
MSGLWLVAMREITVRIRTKSFLIGLAVSALLVVGIALLPAVFGDDDKPKVAVVGTQLPTGDEVEYVSVADRAAAEKAVLDDEVSAALIDGDTVLSKGTLDTQLGFTLRGAYQAQQITSAGVTLRDLDLQQIGPAESETDGARTGIATLVTIVMFMLIIFTSIYVAMGVVEEKGSRIVELLLVSVRPWQLLGGKIVGLVILGLLNMLVIAVSGLVAVNVAGQSGTMPPELLSIVLSSIVWFLLASVFYAALAAMFGSLVSRQEDVNSVLTPMNMTLMIAYFISFFVAQQPGSTVARIFSIVPPFSAMVMPVRDAAADVPLWEVLLAAALMVIASIIVVKVAATIYERAVLRTGARLKLTQLLRAK